MTPRDARRADTRALILMVASAACFAAMAPFTRKWLTRIEPQSLVLARALVMLLVFGIWGGVAGIPLSGRNRTGLVLRGFLGYLAISCYVWSTQHLSPGKAVLLQYSHPVFVAALAPLLLRERPGPLHWPLVLAGFAGLSLALGVAGLRAPAGGSLDPHDGTTDHAWVIGLTGACLSGLAYMTVRRVAATEAPVTIVFWFALVMLPASLIGTLVPWSPLDALAGWFGSIARAAPVVAAPPRHQLPATAMELVGYASVVAVGLIGQITLTEGLARAGAARAVAVTMAGPLFGLAFDLLFFGQLPTVASLAGTAVVVAALVALGLLKPSQPITEGEAE